MRSKRPGPTRAPRLRANEFIRAAEVRLITDEDQEVISLADALQRAKEQELDLVEISPNAKPPICKILDLGSYLYQLKKKEKKQKAHSKQIEVKMVRFGFRTDKHDLDRQANRAREFLSERHLVKAGILLRGREFTNQEYAKEKLHGFVEGLMDAAEVEQPMKKQGNQYIVILRPKKGGVPDQKKTSQESGVSPKNPGS